MISYIACVDDYIVFSTLSYGSRLDHPNLNFTDWRSERNPVKAII